MGQTCFQLYQKDKSCDDYKINESIVMMFANKLLVRWHIILWYNSYIFDLVYFLSYWKHIKLHCHMKKNNTAFNEKKKKHFLISFCHINMSRKNTFQLKTRNKFIYKLVAKFYITKFQKFFFWVCLSYSVNILAWNFPECR